MAESENSWCIITVIRKSASVFAEPRVGFLLPTLSFALANSTHLKGIQGQRGPTVAFHQTYSFDGLPISVFPGPSIVTGVSLASGGFCGEVANERDCAIH